LNPVPHVSAPPDSEIPAREPIVSIPPVTGWLIAINVAIHVLRTLLPPGTDDRLVEAFAFAPAELRHPDGLTLLSLITYQFLHGGWDHLGMNMVTLLAFGAGVEPVVGKARYLILYLGGGVAGALTETAVAAPGSDGVVLGASAGISAVFGALLIVRALYPRRAGRFGFVPMALLWIVVMALTGITGFGANGAPVAWVAHIGGFVAGIGFGFLFKQRSRARPF
jgi:membrane associated rhomboid family serine protease